MPVHDWSRVQAGIFHDFHHAWINALKVLLNDKVLPSPYYALAEQIAGGLGPDVIALEDQSPPNPTGESEAEERTTATTFPKVRFTASTETEQYAKKANRITIRHSSSGDRVVAVIEIVSPGNKSSRQGLRSFVNKAVELLTAQINVLILDLHPPGPRDPNGLHAAIWSEIASDDFELPAEQPLTLVSYAPSWDQTRAFIEPTSMGATLPDMPLFLGSDFHVNVPLEESYLLGYAAVPKRWRRILEGANEGNGVE